MICIRAFYQNWFTYKEISVDKYFKKPNILWTYVFSYCLILTEHNHLCCGTGLSHKIFNFTSIFSAVFSVWYVMKCNWILLKLVIHFCKRFTFSWIPAFANTQQFVIFIPGDLRSGTSFSFAFQRDGDAFTCYYHWWEITDWWLFWIYELENHTILWKHFVYHVSYRLYICCMIKRIGWLALLIWLSVLRLQ